MTQPPLNTPPPPDPRALWRHFSETYFSLRLGLVVLAFGFPFVLYGWGRVAHGLDLQPSMSAYFWAAAAAEQCAASPMRTVFVGFLFAIAVGLHLYKGITRLENYLLNGAAFCAAVVATVPERLPKQEPFDTRIAELYARCPAVKAWALQQDWPPIHYMAAVTLFVLLAIVAWACASHTLEYLPQDRDRVRYRRRYKALAIAMLAFPVPGLLVAWIVGRTADWVFFVEAAGVLTFGLYWLVKSRELSLSHLEAEPHVAVQRAASAHPERSAPPGGGPI
jgi:hypothetical protein